MGTDPTVPPLVSTNGPQLTVVPDAPDLVPAHSWQPIDVVAAGAAEPELPTIGGGLIYPGRVHTLTGEPESGKSLFAQAIAADELRRGRDVEIIDFETSPGDTLARFRDLGVDDETISAHLNYVQPDEPFGARPEIFSDLEQRHRDRNPSLVIIDAAIGALTLHALDGNSARDVELLHRGVIRHFRTNGAAVLLIDHVVKQRDQRGRFASGSERKLGAVDVHLGTTIIEPVRRGHTGRIKVDVHKDRPGYLNRPTAAEVTFTSAPGTGLLTVTISTTLTSAATATEAWRPTIYMERVSRHLESCPEPVSLTAIVDAVEGKTEWIRKAVDVLLAEGWITETTGPRRARLLSSVTPFRAADASPSNPGIATTPTPTPTLPDALTPTLTPTPPIPVNQAESRTPSHPAPTPSLTPSHDPDPGSAPPTRGAHPNGTGSRIGKPGYRTTLHTAHDNNHITTHERTNLSSIHALIIRTTYAK